MNELVQTRLREILVDHGRRVMDDPGRLEALLHDYCGGYRREVSALLSALKEGIPTGLSNASGNLPREALVGTLAKRLEEHQGLANDVARWAVGAWAFALGMGDRASTEGRLEDRAIGAGAADDSVIGNEWVGEQLERTSGKPIGDAGAVSCTDAPSPAARQGTSPFLAIMLALMVAGVGVYVATRAAPTPPATIPPVAAPAPAPRPVPKPPVATPAPAPRPVPKPPVATPAPPPRPTAKPSVAAPAARPSVLIVPSQLKLTSTSPTRVVAGGTVLFDLSFVLTAKEPAPVEDTLAWRSSDSQLHYGTYRSFVASPGVNTRQLTFTVEASRSPGTELPLFGVIRINRTLYHTQVPILVRVAELVDQLKLVPTSATQVPPGAKVTFDLSYVLTTQESVLVDDTIAWRLPDGQLRYGNYTSATLSSGAHTFRHLWFTVGKSWTPGTQIPVFGILRINGTLYQTQEAVLVKVVTALVDQLKLVPTSVIQVPPGGTVSFDLSFVLAGSGGPVTAEYAFALREASGRLTYTEYKSFMASPGINTRHVSLILATSRVPGAEIPVYVAVRINGTLYQTQEAVPIVVVAR